MTKSRKKSASGFSTFEVDNTLFISFHLDRFIRSLIAFQTGAGIRLVAYVALLTFEYQNWSKKLVKNFLKIIYY